MDTELIWGNFCQYETSFPHISWKFDNLLNFYRATLLEIYIFMKFYTDVADIYMLVGFTLKADRVTVGSWKQLGHIGSL